MTATELKGQLETYLAVRLALGYRDCSLRNLMEDFVRYVIVIHQDGPIRARIAVDWACMTASHNGASRVAYRLSAARGFLTHVRATFPDTEVPQTGLLKKSPRRIPYLFSKKQLADLLKTASALGPAVTSRANFVHSTRPIRG